MIFLPGPAFVVIPVGLAILATEFAWAKVLLDKLKEKINWKTTAKGISSRNCQSCRRKAATSFCLRR